MITFAHKGDFSKTNRFLEHTKNLSRLVKLDRYGREGVRALSAATPVDSGETADSWSYEVSYAKEDLSITWTNSNVNNGVSIAIILQYGHGTGTGGYVQGRDYINPAIRPVFDRIASDLWKEVTR